MTFVGIFHLLRDGHTALFLALREGHEKVVDSILLQVGADHAAVDRNTILSVKEYLLRDGDTALIRTSREGREKVVDLLLQAGADHAFVDK